MISATLFWFILAAMMLVIELMTSSFVLMGFGLGALGAAFVAWAGGSVAWQLAVFTVLTLLFFAFIRPLLKKWHKPHDRHGRRTNIDAYIGREARVAETIDQSQCTGRISLDGENWQAVSADGSVIGTGEAVRVVKTESIIFTVERIGLA